MPLQTRKMRMSLPLNTCPVSLICVRTAPRSVFSLSRSVSARLSAVRAFTCFTEALPKKDIDAVKKYVINPVESREASLSEYKTLKAEYDIPQTVETLDGFCALSRKGLEEFVSKYGLAMDADDIEFCQNYFKSEQRDPTVTEIRMIDTYWSDHCRHTTFLTTIDSVTFEDETVQAAYDEYLAVRQKARQDKAAESYGYCDRRRA